MRERSREGSTQETRAGGTQHKERETGHTTHGGGDQGHDGDGGERMQTHDMPEGEEGAGRNKGRPHPKTLPAVVKHQGTTSLRQRIYPGVKRGGRRPEETG